MAPKEQIAELICKAHEAFYAEFEPGAVYSAFVADYLIANGVTVEAVKNE